MQILLLLAHAYMHFAWKLQLGTQCVHQKYTHWVANCNSQEKCIMHEQTTKGFYKMNICISRFGVRSGWTKYLNEFMPFGYVSLCTWLDVQAFVNVLFFFLFIGWGILWLLCLLLQSFVQSLHQVGGNCPAFWNFNIPRLWSSSIVHGINSMLICGTN